MTRPLGGIGAVRAADRLYRSWAPIPAEYRAPGPRTALADTLYSAAVRRLGLYGAAYFGAPSTAADRRRLRDAWREARRIAGERDGWRLVRGGWERQP